MRLQGHLFCLGVLPGKTGPSLQTHTLKLKSFIDEFFNETKLPQRPETKSDIFNRIGGNAGRPHPLGLNFTDWLNTSPRSCGMPMGAVTITITIHECSGTEGST